MTQDEVIALAHQMLPDAWRYDTNDDFATLTFDELTRFANAVEAKVKADLLAGAGEPVGGAYLCDACDTPFDGGHYCPSRECGHNTSTKQDVYTADQLAAAVLREREECAKVCETFNSDELGCLDACAAAIRARGNT